MTDMSASRSGSAGMRVSPVRYEMRAWRRSSWGTVPAISVSTPRSWTASRPAGLVSSQTMVRREPPNTVVRILVGLSQFTCTWARAPFDSHTDR